MLDFKEEIKPTLSICQKCYKCEKNKNNKPVACWDVAVEKAPNEEGEPFVYLMWMLKRVNSKSFENLWFQIPEHCNFMLEHVLIHEEQKIQRFYLPILFLKHVYNHGPKICLEIALRVCQLIRSKF